MKPQELNMYELKGVLLACRAIIFSNDEDLARRLYKQATQEATTRKDNNSITLTDYKAPDDNLQQFLEKWWVRAIKNQVSATCKQCYKDDDNNAVVCPSHAMRIKDLNNELKLNLADVLAGRGSYLFDNLNKSNKERSE